MPNRNGVLTARYDKFWSQCHSKRAAAIIHPPPPSNPSQIRTYSRSNPTSSSVLLFKLLQAANSLHLTCGNFLPSHLESWWGRGAARRRILGAGRVKGGGVGWGEMNTGPGNAPRTGPRRKAKQCGASTAAPLPPAIPTTLFPVFPQPAPSPRNRVYAVLSPPLHPPTLCDSPCPSRQRVPRGPRMHTTFPLAHSSQHHPSVLSPRPVPPAPAVSAAILPPNSDSPLPLPTAPEQLLHPCNRSGKCLPHLPPQPLATVPYPTTPES